MLLSEITKQAVTDLKANKLRSTLTLFGIIWGIMAIMILLGWGFGFRQMMQDGMGKIGKDLIFFSGGHTSTGIGGYKAGRPIHPDLDDIEAIQQLCPSVDKVNPQVARWFHVKYGNESRSYNMRGVLPNAKQLNNWFVAQGRFINQDDINNRRRFAFIGNNIKEQYKVRGVLNSQSYDASVGSKITTKVSLKQESIDNAPQVTGFSSQGSVGDQVSLTGNYLKDAVRIDFRNDTVTGFDVVQTSEHTELITYVPQKAIDGYITVQTQGGKTKTATTFEVINDTSFWNA